MTVRTRITCAERLQRRLQRRMAFPGSAWQFLAVLADSRLPGIARVAPATCCRELPVSARR